MILKVFSNLNDSMILCDLSCVYIRPIVYGVYYTEASVNLIFFTCYTLSESLGYLLLHLLNRDRNMR